jgi:hypothetical protein
VLTGKGKEEHALLTDAERDLVRVAPDLLAAAHAILTESFPG